MRPVPERTRNPLFRLVFWLARRQLGAVPLSWRILARRPPAFVVRALGDAVHGRGRHVPSALASLATLRAALLIDCPFCIDILSVQAKITGIRPDQVNDLVRWRESEAFTDDERMVLALADAMTVTPTEVPGELRARLIERFGEAGFVEIAATIGHENARARSGRALGLRAQGFATAAGCKLPARE